VTKINLIRRPRFCEASGPKDQKCAKGGCTNEAGRRVYVCVCAQAAATRKTTRLLSPYLKSSSEYLIGGEENERVDCIEYRYMMIVTNVLCGIKRYRIIYFSVLQ